MTLCGAVQVHELEGELEAALLQAQVGALQAPVCSMQGRDEKSLRTLKAPGTRLPTHVVSVSA